MPSPKKQSTKKKERILTIMAALSMFQTQYPSNCILLNQAILSKNLQPSSFWSHTAIEHVHWVLGSKESSRKLLSIDLKKLWLVFLWQHKAPMPLFSIIVNKSCWQVLVSRMWQLKDCAFIHWSQNVLSWWVETIWDFGNYILNRMSWRKISN
jgi:hypothetical protein